MLYDVSLHLIYNYAFIKGTIRPVAEIEIIIKFILFTKNLFPFFMDAMFSFKNQK